MRSIAHRVREYIIYGQEQTLHEATKNNKIRRVMHILDRGQDVNAKDKHGLTALHIACWFNYKKLAQLLLERGADIYVKNKAGKTSLTLAKQKGNVQMVLLLEDVLTKLEAQKETQSTVLEEEEDAVPKAIQFPLPQKREEFYLFLYRAGKRMLRESENNTPPALWTRILGSASSNVDSLYYFVRAKPDFFS